MNRRVASEKMKTRRERSRPRLRETRDNYD